MEYTRLGSRTTTRAGSDPIADRMYREPDDAVVHAVADVAKARGLPMAQVALAWMLHQDVITAPIVGATKPGHVEGRGGGGGRRAVRGGDRRPGGALRPAPRSGSLNPS